MTENEYRRYTHDFNTACAGDGSGFGAFFDRWYEPDATFEYVPAARKNTGRADAVAFWASVHEQMLECIREHRSFLASDSAVAVQAPIDFFCKRDLEWVGVPHKAGSSFRLEMAAFYDLSPRGRIEKEGE